MKRASASTYTPSPGAVRRRPLTRERAAAALTRCGVNVRSHPGCDKPWSARKEGEGKGGTLLRPVLHHARIALGLAEHGLAATTEARASEPRKAAGAARTRSRLAMSSLPTTLTRKPADMRARRHERGGLPRRGGIRHSCQPTPQVFLVGRAHTKVDEAMRHTEGVARQRCLRRRRAACGPAALRPSVTGRRRAPTRPQHAYSCMLHLQVSAGKQRLQFFFLSKLPVHAAHLSLQSRARARARAWARWAWAWRARARARALARALTSFRLPRSPGHWHVMSLATDVAVAGRGGATFNRCKIYDLES